MGKQMRKSEPQRLFLWVLGLSLSLLFILSTASSLLAAQQSSQSIQVVIDENYPPYSFRNSQGELQGISIDQWKLFEQKTGIKVYITGKPWNEAYESMLAGQFDVIDTISYSEQRTTLFDFTKPYATIEVPIFFRIIFQGFIMPTRSGVLKSLQKRGPLYRGLKRTRYYQYHGVRFCRRSYTSG